MSSVDLWALRGIVIMYFALTLLFEYLVWKGAI